MSYALPLTSLNTKEQATAPKAETRLDRETLWRKSAENRMQLWQN